MALSELEIKLGIMRAAGLNDRQIYGLAYLKQRIETGKLNDLTLEYKRREFLGYLYKHGRLREWAVTMPNQSQGEETDR